MDKESYMAALKSSYLVVGVLQGARPLVGQPGHGGPVALGKGRLQLKVDAWLELGLVRGHGGCLGRPSSVFWGI